MKLADALQQHYLSEIVCDHERKMDNPRCACSLVDLGWHPSVGAAVQAWVDHVLTVVAPARAGKLELAVKRDLRDVGKLPAGGHALAEISLIIARAIDAEDGPVTARAKTPCGSIPTIPSE